MSRVEASNKTRELTQVPLKTWKKILCPSFWMLARQTLRALSWTKENSNRLAEYLSSRSPFWRHMKLLDLILATILQVKATLFKITKMSKSSWIRRQRRTCESNLSKMSSVRIWIQLKIMWVRKSSNLSVWTIVCSHRHHSLKMTKTKRLPRSNRRYRLLQRHIESFGICKISRANLTELLDRKLPLIKSIGHSVNKCSDRCHQYLQFR